MRHRAGGAADPIEFSVGRYTILSVFSLLAVLVLVAPWPGLVLSSGEREIHVVARDYAFTPGVLQVSQGQRVTLVFEAEDVTHGLLVDGHDVDVVAVPGRAGRATFMADRPGKFRLRCSKVCGTLHPFMLGELVVTPNVPVWRAIGLAALAGVGTVMFLCAGRRESRKASA
jgi:heme/copper-type cytochrome/quinol oxidase subunit 2